MAKLRNIYWELILYKEWACDIKYFFSTLQRYGIKAVLSPLHDSDVFQKDSPTDSYKKGDKKKPHYHCILIFDSLKSVDQVLALCQECIPQLTSIQIQKIISIRGALDYLTHKNNSEKAQYDEQYIVTTSNCNIEDLKAEYGDKKYYCDIFKYIHDNNIKNLMQLTDFLVEIKDNAKLDLVMQRAYFFNIYLNSKMESTQKKGQGHEIAKKLF